MKHQLVSNIRREQQITNFIGNMLQQIDQRIIAAGNYNKTPQPVPHSQRIR